MFIDLTDPEWDDFFLDSLTIETVIEGEPNDLGEIVNTTGPLDGHSDIECQIVFKSGKLLNDQNEVVAVFSAQIGLRGYFPDIETELSSKRQLTALAGSKRYKVLSAGSDSMHVKTTLYVELT